MHIILPVIKKLQPDRLLIATGDTSDAYCEIRGQSPFNITWVKDDETPIGAEEALSAFIKSAWQGPVLGVNLLKFRDQAEYPDDSFEPCTGQEAWLRYEEQALVVAEKYNLEPVIRATVEQTLQPAYGEE